MSQQQTTEPPVIPDWDDEMWEELWERTLGQVDRHRFALAVARREVPDDALARRVVPELARRWRTQCLVYTAVWGTFAWFWLMVGLAEIDVRGEAVTALPWLCAAIGAVITLGSLAFRHRIRLVARPHRRG